MRRWSLAERRSLTAFAYRALPWLAGALVAFLVGPHLLPAATRLAVVGALGLGALVVGLGADPALRHGAYVRRGTALALAGAAVLFWFVGALGIRWQPYSEARLAAAARAEQPAMVWFTAEWCAACAQLDGDVFANRNVQAAAEDYVALQVDMTTPSETTAALAAHYQVESYPTVIFFGRDGGQRYGARVEGVVGPDEFTLALARGRKAGPGLRR